MVASFPAPIRRPDLALAMMGRPYMYMQLNIHDFTMG